MLVGKKCQKSTSFKNNLGLCDLSKKPNRISKAPIIPTDDIDPLNTGSCFALKK